MFTVFAHYDDEGYMLVALDSFIRQGGLYDNVFTQYGPFYFEAWGALFSLFGIPVTHDNGRLVTMAAWLVTSLVVGLSMARITGSVILGLIAQVLVFASIGTLINEPMHPGGLICLLLAAIIAISCLMRNKVSVGTAALLGGAVAALIMVKVNVGLFALAALMLVCVATYTPLADRRWLRLVVEIGFVVLPVVLMAGKLGEPWARQYAVHVLVASLALVMVLRTRQVERRSAEELWWMLGGLLAVGFVCCLALLGSGTSINGLVDGLIRQPLRQSDAFSLSLGLSKKIYVLDLCALVAAFAYWYATRGGRRPLSAAWIGGGSLLSVLIGVQMALSPIGRTVPFEATSLPGYQLSLLAFAWIALVLPGGPTGRATAFSRLLLPALAVMQALHAFPVAGSQVQWSAFLLAPVGILCVAGGVRGLSYSLSDLRERRAVAAVAAVVAVLLVGHVANETLRKPLEDARAAYDSRVSLNLPGARDVRLDSTEVALYQQITTTINENCSSFVMLPGMDSFYFWTEHKPPTGYNATGWPTLFDDAHQRRVIQDVDQISGLCLLEHESLALGWGAGEIPDGPLVAFMRREFQPLVEIGDYRLLKRPADSGSST